MKLLLSNLDSLLPPHSPNTKEMMATPERLDEAVKYIKELRMRVEKMKETIERLGSSEGTSQQGNMIIDVKIQDMGSGLYVLLLSLRGGFSAFTEALFVLKEEGMEIVTANFDSRAMSCITIRCSVADNTGNGFDAVKIVERLKKIGAGYQS
ncbi:putative transcription factor bHLH family [Dioscorea sansibarensis]